MYHVLQKRTETLDDTLPFQLIHTYNYTDFLKAVQWCVLVGLEWCVSWNGMVC